MRPRAGGAAPTGGSGKYAAGPPFRAVQGDVLVSAGPRYPAGAGDRPNEAPLDRWRQARDAVRRAIEENGYDQRRGVFMQAFRHPELDASLLLLPTSGLIDYEDERMVRTVDAIAEDLAEDGLLRRYASDSDGLRGREGVFLPCSFWLAECLARQNRISEAHAVFQRALSTGNDLGLFAEEYDVENREMLGNFPQGLTHLSLIAAAVALAERGDRGRVGFELK